MPIYSYLCPDHGEHDILSRAFKVSLTSECPTCGRETINKIALPARFDVQRDWNEKANSYRINPYTQAKAQLTNMNRENRESRDDIKDLKITEKMIQETAKQIDRADKGIGRPESPVTRTAKVQKKLAKENISKD